MAVKCIKLRNCYQVCDVDINDDIKVDFKSIYIVETEHGVDMGQSCGCLKVRNGKDSGETKGKFLRLASEDDINKIPEIEAIEKKAFNICREKIVNRKLDMKLVSVKSLFDKTKIIFFFVAENRIDFRELVKDLAAVFRTRIEMRQIGVRDETRIVGGFGLCGRQLCCNYLNDDFEPVSIKMAKEQNLNLNSLKISGMCGRLLCCLGYEYNVYKELNTHLPAIDTKIKAGEKIYNVISVDTLKGQIRLRNEDHIITVSNNDIEKKGNEFSISQEVIDRLSQPVIKEETEDYIPKLT